MTFNTWRKIDSRGPKRWFPLRLGTRKGPTAFHADTQRRRGDWASALHSCNQSDQISRVRKGKLRAFTAMISQFFVLSQRGDNIVFRDCKSHSGSLAFHPILQSFAFLGFQASNFQNFQNLMQIAAKCRREAPRFSSGKWNSGRTTATATRHLSL